MTRLKPIIGITLDAPVEGDKYHYSRYPWYALRQGYAKCVEQAGGIPIMLPYVSEVNDLVGIIDGLIISGGDEDVPPKFYQQEITSERVKTNEPRATFELNLIKAAIQEQLPILGICNGLQIINVALGGSLIQDIATQYQTNINHEQPHPKNEPSHVVNINAGSKLASWTTETSIKVNSTHHQAIDQLGNNLKVAAVAEDGIIEAIETNDQQFLIGIQWHCEYLNTQLDYNLFNQLVLNAQKK